MEHKVLQIVQQSSDAQLARLIIDSYKEVEKNYFLKSWKTSELDAGHFVEAVRRFLEHNLFGTYTTLGKSLPRFNEQTLQQYMNATGDESYRIHIPRTLYTIYGIRNKRGVGHISRISPNHLDATFIVSSVKWVLAEIIRINSTFTPDETTKIVDNIVERPVEGIWDQGQITRLLVDNLTLKEQIIFLLFTTDTKMDKELQGILEPKSEKYFKQILRQLHKDRLIEYQPDGNCFISPKGIAFAEKLVLGKIST